ncbi:hypothetical protein ACIOD2_26290 [Amycolatopsis sp. NPDC088138]|uniref:hypothetical protein n=1 Tax=Amycolatopsis sp. NPDC088138 TaxID=3363938 RepID=UPI00381B5177
MREVGKYTAGAVAAVLAGAVLAGAPATAAAAEGCHWTAATQPVPDGYRLEDLGSGDGAGAVAGTLRPKTAGDPLAGVVWRGGTANVLGSAFGLDTTISDVNSAGVAVGSYAEPHVFGGHEPNHAVRYVDGAYERLPEPPGFVNTTAIRINAHGDILGAVGESGDTGVYRTVVWPADTPGTVRVLPAPHEGFQVPAGIGEDGTVPVAIIGALPGGGFAGYLWPPGGATTVRLASPAANGADGEVVPTAIGGDRVAGYTGDAGVFLWKLDGSIDRPLPGLLRAEAMNAAGDIAGPGDNGSTVVLPSGGGPAQIVSTGEQNVDVKELTEEGDIYAAVTTTTPEWRQDVVRWHCG